MVAPFGAKLQHFCGEINAAFMIQAHMGNVHPRSWILLPRADVDEPIKRYHYNFIAHFISHRALKLNQQPADRAGSFSDVVTFSRTGVTRNN